MLSAPDVANINRQIKRKEAEGWVASPIFDCADRIRAVIVNQKDVVATVPANPETKSLT